MKSVDRFLNYIHGNNESVIRVYKNRRMIPISKNDVSEENKNGDIYFVVNSGGAKDNEINMFNAVFIDLDCGKNKDKDYHSTETVNLYKANKMKEINKFTIKPTFIIETRNGFHIYWVLNHNISVDKWRECIGKLIKRFNSDKQVKNPARLMRLPFTYWMKDKSNPYYVDIVQFNDIAYNVEDILDGLVDVDMGELIVQDNNNIYNINIPCTENSPNIQTSTNRMLQAIKLRDVEYLKSILGLNQSTTIQNEQDFFDYVYKIDFSNLLSISNSKSFCCIFHNDRSPSASIFSDPVTGNYIYHCNSDSCGISYNLIQIIQVITKWKTHKVLEFIKEIYQIEVIKTDWQKEQIAVLETNKQMIISGAFEQSYPDTFKLIKRYLPQLITMLEIAIINVRDENYTDDNGNIVFFISNSYLMKELNYRQPTRINQRNILFAFLKLLKRLDKDEIPEKDLAKALEIQKKYNHHKIVNFFSIGDYDVFQMSESERMARSWKDNNMSMTGLSYEGVYRTFGYEVAWEIYPQHKNTFIKTDDGYEEVNRTTSKASDERTNEIAITIIKMIESQGYAIEKDVVCELQDRYGKRFTQTQIKRSLQEILDGYNLQRVRANKQLKEKYNMDTKGYPFLMLKNNQ